MLYFSVLSIQGKGKMVKRRSLCFIDDDPAELVRLKKAIGFGCHYCIRTNRGPIRHQEA